MTNAKVEFEGVLTSVVGKPNCASIRCHGKEFILHQDYDKIEYEAFLNALDFEYDGGFGIQELEGIVLFPGGVWAERGEYDGSEWWKLHEYPEIPVECLK